MKTDIITRRRFVAAATLAPGVFAQRLSAQQGGLVVRTAIVNGIYGPTALSATGRDSQQFTIDLAAGGTVWKGDWGADFRSLTSGDQLIARGYLTATGLSAKIMWANIDNFYGTVSYVQENNYLVTTVRGQSRYAFVTAKTVNNKSEPFAMGDVQVGRSIQTLGLQMPDGTLQATRVTVYVLGWPTTAPAQTMVILPNGQRRQVQVQF